MSNGGLEGEVIIMLPGMYHLNCIAEHKVFIQQFLVDCYDHSVYQYLF